MAADGNGNWATELFKKSLDLFRDRATSSLMAVMQPPP